MGNQQQLLCSSLRRPHGTPEVGSDDVIRYIQHKCQELARDPDLIMRALVVGVGQMRPARGWKLRDYCR
jgi:hypothetical protein